MSVKDVVAFSQILQYEVEKWVEYGHPSEPIQEKEEINSFVLLTCSSWETSDYQREKESTLSAPPLAFNPPEHKEKTRRSYSSAPSEITNVDKQ